MNKYLNARKKLKRILKNKDNYFRYAHQMAIRIDYESKTIELAILWLFCIYCTHSTKSLWLSIMTDQSLQNATEMIVWLYKVLHYPI